MNNDERPIGNRPFDCLTKHMLFWNDLVPKEAVPVVVIKEPVENIPDMF